MSFVTGDLEHISLKSKLDDVNILTKILRLTERIENLFRN